MLAIGGVMVERYGTPDIKSLNQIDSATTELERFQKKIRQPSKSISDEDINELLSTLKRCNEAIESDALEEKKLTQSQNAEVNDRIDHAIQAILSFKSTKTDEVAKKDVDQMIVSLFATLGKEVDKFKQNVENLREKWKIVTRKVQGSQKSKEF